MTRIRYRTSVIQSTDSKIQRILEKNKAIRIIYKDDEPIAFVFGESSGDNARNITKLLTDQENEFQALWDDEN